VIVLLFSHLAKHVILVNILHPIVTAVLGIVIFLVLASSSMVDLRLKAVVLFDLVKVGNALGEKGEGIHEYNGDLIKQIQLSDSVENNSIA
jgi:hypothetical protein